jgi:hypothetical protein
VCVCARFCAAEFQQMDIDHVIGAPHAEWMPGAPPQAAIIRMFGVTAAGARPVALVVRMHAASSAASKDAPSVAALQCVTLHAAFALFAVSAPQAAACAATSTASSPTGSGSSF